MAPRLNQSCLLSVPTSTLEQGQCNAVNIGAQVAEGDYLMVSNSDMYYAPRWNKNLKFDYPVFSPNLVEPTNNHGSRRAFLKADGGFTLNEFKRGLLDHFIAMNIDEIKQKNQASTFPSLLKETSLTS
jgi:hypothetical protein